ncbi:alpha/beta hydrolase [candidate division KSB1 bacterium]|nr:alpha/beta hydrolase [candidate division KSB1 bacterium]
MLHQNTIKNLIGALATILPPAVSVTAQQNESVSLAVAHEIIAKRDESRTTSALSDKMKVNGLNMYYKLAGEGEPVVFIAGLASDHLEWLPAHVPTFTAAGYRCVLFDNRDAGQTDESPIAAYTIKQLADDAAGLLKQLGIKQAHIVGESMGGMIAQELAIKYPELVRSPTLVCSWARSEPFHKALSESWKNLRRKFSLEESFQTFGLWFFSSRFYENPEAEQTFLAEVRANPYPQSVAAFERQWDAILTQNTLDRLSRITAPSHVIAGDRDMLVPLRLSRIMAEKIPGAKLTVLPESSHVLAFENPAAFNQVALDFLKEH